MPSFLAPAPRASRKRKARDMTSAYRAGMAAARKMQRAPPRRSLRGASMLGLELKFLDCAWNGVALNTSTDGADGEIQPSSGCTGCISVPQQGDTGSQRDGRKFVIKSVWVSGVIETNAVEDQGNGSEFTGFYFALVLDTQCNGATINSEDVFINPSTSASAMFPTPLRNLQNSKRFRILDSKYIRAGGAYAVPDGANTGSLSAQNTPVLNLNWKGNLTVDTSGTTANVASATDNAIHLIAYAASTGPSPTFTGKSRVRFMG